MLPSLDDGDEQTEASGAFRRLPNAVARDRQLGAAALVLLAWRSTMVGKYEMNERHLMKAPPVAPGSGLGKNNIREAIRQMCNAGYLVRYQPPAKPDTDGHFAGVIERVTLPACGASGLAGQMVFRRWFDRLLTVKQMAAFIYLRAGTGGGPSVYASELAERFAWSRPTASKVIADLIALGLLSRTRHHAPTGRIMGVSYRVPHRSHMLVWPAAATVKKPGNGLRGDGFPGDLLTPYPPHTPLREEPSSHTETGHHVPQSETLGESDFVCSNDVEGQAFSDEHLLGWLSDEQERLLGDYLDHIEYSIGDVIEQIAAAVPDAQLVAFIKEATAGRVHRALLTPAGLYAFRYIATFYYSTTEDGDEQDPLKAVAWLLNAMHDRQAVDGDWINSLKLVAGRIIGDAYGYGAVSERLYVRPSPPRYAVNGG